MRKLFRMKHEPCTGECYSVADVLDLNILPFCDRPAFLRRLAWLHDKLCGDARYGLGLDRDDDPHLYVASFLSPNGLELFASHYAHVAVDRMVAAATSHFTSSAYTPPVHTDDCRHQHSVVEFALQHSRLSPEDQRDLRSHL